MRQIGAKPVLAGRHFGPASDKSSPRTNAPGAALPATTFYGTPQSMDPTALLKRNMKTKVQHEITAPVGGTVTEVAAAEGQQVAAGDLLVLVEEG